MGESRQTHSGTEQQLREGRKATAHARERGGGHTGTKMMRGVTGASSCPKIEMMSEISIPDFGTLPLTQNRRYKVFEAKSRMCVTSTLRVKVLISSAHPPLESRQRLADASKNLAKLRLMRAEKITFLSTPMCIRMLRSPASARRVKGPSLASATLSAIIYYCTSVCADDEELYHK